MASNNNLDSIRELSHSQLEALLRYDSPPETPIQPTDLTNISQNNDDAALCDSIFDHNREQFGSQIGSQIDFSVFQRCSQASTTANNGLSPFNLPSAETDDCISDNGPLKTIEIPDVSMPEKDKTDFDDDTFLENSFSIDFCDAELESFTPKSCGKENDFNFEDADTIFKAIEFDTNFEISHFNQLQSPQHPLRKVFDKVFQVLS